MLTIGFLGGGNMAGALIGGLLAGGPRSDLKVHVTDLHAENSRGWQHWVRRRIRPSANGQHPVT